MFGQGLFLLPHIWRLRGINFCSIARHEKRLWFVTLFLGTCMCYSTRTTMPLLVPAVAAELNWSKTDSGTVLSSFFWGYTLTQVNLINLLALVNDNNNK